MHIAYGGVAPKTIMAPKLMAALRGKPWCEETLQQGLEAVRSDVSVGENAPGGRSEYRNSLAASFLFKFYVQVCVWDCMVPGWLMDCCLLGAACCAEAVGLQQMVANMPCLTTTCRQWSFCMWNVVHVWPVHDYESRSECSASHSH